MAAKHVYETPPPECASDWTIPQNWHAFTPDEHAVWDALLARQSRALAPLASKTFLAGLDILNLSSPGIPDFRDLNRRLAPATGWQVVAVPGWIPNEPFFNHLVNKRFPVANFLRDGKDMDYSEEPDMFHDVFGHVPMLANPVFSDFLLAYGKAGLRAEKLGAADYLGRLWLYTVEFGLVVEDGELRAYGAGLLSSFAETVAAVRAPDVRRLCLSIPRVMRRKYHFDRFQSVYFVVESFEELLRQTEKTNFAVLYDEIAALGDLDPDVVEEGDHPFILPPGRMGGKPGCLTEQERKAQLAKLDSWCLVEGGAAIERHFTFGDFAEAFGFMSRAARIAETMDHHPEWSNVFNRVDVRLTTHDAGGLSMRDIALAQALDQLATSA